MLRNIIKTSVLGIKLLGKNRIIRLKVNLTKRLTNSSSTYGYSMIRCLSSKPSDNEVPPIMDFKVEDIGNVVFTPFVINFHFKPFIDNDFDLKKFIKEAKQKVCEISDHLSNNNIEGIRGLVTEKAFKEISDNYSKYSTQQKFKLKVVKEDIGFCLPLSVTIDKKSDDTQVVKIVVVLDHMPNASQKANQIKEEMPSKKTELSDMTLRLFHSMINQNNFCVYQFTRVYGKEDNDSKGWIVSKLLHFKASDVLKKEGILTEIDKIVKTFYQKKD